MKNIDDELASAVAKLESAAQQRSAQGSKAGTATVQPEDAPRRSWGLLVGLGVVMAAILTLFFSSSDEAVVYAYGADEIKKKSTELQNRQVRMMGHLVSGSLVRRDDPCEYRFFVKKGGEQVPVRYAQCVVPDTFRDVKGVEVEVTVEGRLASDGHLEASNIFAKCPSKYEMGEMAAQGMAPKHGGAEKQPDFIEPRLVENVR